MLVSPLPLIVLLTGVYFLFRLRAFFLLHPLRTAAGALRALGSKGAVRSFCLALAGTLGVGNVLGVCVGIMIGGKGSVLWMLLSVIPASAVKYAELVAARDRHSGGSIYALVCRMPRCGAALSRVYAVTMIGLALVMGAALQSGAFVGAAGEILDTPPALLAAGFTAAVMLAILGGTRVIERLTEVIIPLSAGVYVLLCLAVVVLYRGDIPFLIREMIADAFDFDACLGGVLGSMLGGAAKEGFSRGIMSNEAGAGTSSLAHGRSGILNPAAAGLLGIAEVVFDTGVMCMLTALAVLLPMGDISAFDGGMSLVMSSFSSSLGHLAAVAVSFCVLAFAFATVICWYFYFTEACGWLIARPSPAVMLPLFLAACFLGALTDEILLVSATDALLLLLVCICCAALIKNSDRICFLSEKGGILGQSSRRLVCRMRNDISQGSE